MPQHLVHLLASNPLLLLFAVAAVGYPLGQLRVRGSPIGVAVLGWALEETRNEIPNVGYASIYPAATLAKLVAVQLLVALG